MFSYSFTTFPGLKLGFLVLNLTQGLLVETSSTSQAAKAQTAPAMWRDPRDRGFKLRKVQAVVFKPQKKNIGSGASKMRAIDDIQLVGAFKDFLIFTPGP